MTLFECVALSPTTFIDVINDDIIIRKIHSNNDAIIRVKFLFWLLANECY